MVLRDGYYQWYKGDNAPINKYFRCGEFSCHCEHAECVEQKISADLIKKLTSIRVAVNMPIYTTSGFRCAQKQQELRDQGHETAVGTSQHELGNAVDVYCQNMTDLYSEACDNFEAVGKANTFIHMDTRADKERRWFYK